MSSPSRASAPSGAEPSPDSLRRALVENMPSRVRACVEQEASLVLDSGEEAWTIRIQHRRVSLMAGALPSPTTRVKASPEVLLAVARGRRSGVEAFLAGEVSVRGNLALALQLDGLFTPDTSPEGLTPAQAARFPRYRQVLADGVATSYLEAGPADGEPVVLFHGLGATNASMLPTLWELASTHRVISPDNIGFGATGKPHRRYDPACFAQWALALLDELELERPHLIGNSLGGRISLELALRHPERVASLGLLAPSLAFLHKRAAQPLTKLLHPGAGLMMPPLPRAFMAPGLDLLFAHPNSLPRTWREAAVDEAIRVLRQPMAKWAFTSASREIYLEPARGTAGFWGRLEELEVPATFIFGERDRLVPARFAAPVRHRLPQAQVHVLPNCGHVPQFEQPERTHALLRAQLSASATAQFPHPRSG